MWISIALSWAFVVPKDGAESLTEPLPSKGLSNLIFVGFQRAHSYRKSESQTVTASQCSKEEQTKKLDLSFSNSPSQRVGVICRSKEV